jgi:hypothetical protein
MEARCFSEMSEYTFTVWYDNTEKDNQMEK